MAAIIIDSLLSTFQPENEKVKEYLKHVQLYYGTNWIKEEKQVAILLMVIGSRIYVAVFGSYKATR